MRGALAPRPKPWGVLQGLRVAAVGFSGAARPQPGRTKAEGAVGGVRRRGEVSGAALEVKARREVESQAEQAIGNQKEERKAEKATEQGSAMERNNALEIGSGKTINGLRLVHVSRNVRRAEVREATTGRPVMVAKIWAVAESSPAVESQPAAVAQPEAARPKPQVELAFYRKYTEAMLRRYLQVSMEVGRVPSIMGRELFRGHVSHYKMEGFEDGVIFSIDVERCLAKLRKTDQRIIQRIALQGYTHEEAAPYLACRFARCLSQSYCAAIDRLREIFLAGRSFESLKKLSRGGNGGKLRKQLAISNLAGAKIRKWNFTRVDILKK